LAIPVTERFLRGIAVSRAATRSVDANGPAVKAEPTGVGRCWDSVRGAITLSDVAHSCAVLHAIRVTPHTEAYGREKLTLGLRGSKRDTRLAGGHSQR